jgi:hypothetical protein
MQRGVSEQSAELHKVLSLTSSRDAQGSLSTSEILATGFRPMCFKLDGACLTDAPISSVCAHDNNDCDLATLK